MWNRAGCDWRQATFLRGSASGEDAEGELAAELNALSSDELETRCRRNGLSRRYHSAHQPRPQSRFIEPAMSQY